MKARLIIADDHQVVRQGLREIVSQTTDLQVVAEAADGTEAERLARSGVADLLILDIGLPLRRGVEVLEALRADGIALPVLFFSMYPPAQYAGYARRAGAQGFVGKDADAADLLRAIRRILAGGTSFPGVDRVDRKAAPGGDPFSTLSRRENEVMQGLMAGAGLTEIAAGMGIGTRSVTTYRRRLLDKLGLASNAELVALATRLGRM